MKGQKGYHAVPLSRQPLVYFLSLKKKSRRVHHLRADPHSVKLFSIPTFCDSYEI